MRIAVLECGDLPEALAPRWGRYRDLYARLLEPRGFEVVARRVHEGDVPASAAEADGWLISGSKHAVYEDHPWLPGLAALVRDAAARRVPMVGICFGQQVMAAAFGGRVEKSPAGWGLGVHGWETAAGPLRLCAAHQDQVTALPDGARVTARSAFCPVAALDWPGLPLLAWQGHPEFTTEFERELIELRRGVAYPETTAEAALASLGAPTDEDRVADRMASLYREGR
ncbi:MAG: gamma-glutamyl-gamma-aminobutyrate hydrolase family protein [Paracoccaceae bacterium]